MLHSQDALDDLRKRRSRYNVLQGLFAQFQAHIQALQAPDSSIHGITIVSESPTQTKVEFLHERFFIQFSMRSGLGLLELWDEADLIEDSFGGDPLASVEFTGSGDLKIEQPKGEDPLCLKEDNDCICLLVNWLHEHGSA